MRGATLELDGSETQGTSLALYRLLREALFTSGSAKLEDVRTCVRADNN